MLQASVPLPSSRYHRRSARRAKRLLDLSLSLLLLFLLGPLLALICAAIRMFDGGPVLFRQVRVGKDGKHFICLKFRTMVLDSDARLRAHLASNEEARREWLDTQKLRSDPRITTLGTFLRKSSLDELPQLFNVLVGDMSLVGPRPILPGETYRYGEKLEHYLAVQPGITGLWQVTGRSETSYAERVLLDAQYVQNWSLLLDLVILVLTVPVVITRRGSC
jgi:exopolysaccharide production protein ExoY